MTFNNELKFEEALTTLLSAEKGWDKNILMNPTEEDLIKNWADILFQNNKGIDRLNGQPLTDSEMHQIIAQINELRTPLKLNGFINGKTISIRRDNPNDERNFGKNISLHIYDRMEIAGGKSVYQIARQPQFKSKSPVLRDRRGDVMLLINGMPLIHIELKRSNVPVSEACNQIEKYSKENVFSGIFQLIQIFVAMTPEETVYFANPGADGNFNPNFYFHWADFQNVPINRWEDIAGTLLHIPMAHELVGFYSIADYSDGLLKVMRSYQYYAASQIASIVAKNKNNWCKENQKGGYVSACTGSGKTMTSFKAAQLIAKAGNADKIIFLVDRTELGTQSLEEYKSFSDASDSVQATENTDVLISRLKSKDVSDTLIVTSVQKMSRIKEDAGSRNRQDLNKMQAKRIVFIIDECHRSTFGEMLRTIKDTFPCAMYFGFSGTPIMEENSKKGLTTADLFGNELHAYTLSDGIRDKNVLGFDNYKVCTFKDSELRKAVALRKAGAQTPEEARADEFKRAIFEKYMDKKEISMIEIEEELPTTQYNDVHRRKVIENILENWDIVSYNGKYHAILATSSINDAIRYYRLFKELAPELKITSIFNENDNNDGKDIFKEDGIAEIITDYNQRYKKSFKISSYKSFKKDACLRLAHKSSYRDVSKDSTQVLDLVIVVNQLLTGFDSKYINALYLDKVIENELIIQAFSRTNRVFTQDKKCGVIKWYRKPHTMERFVENAVNLYSKDRNLSIFVEKLDKNIKTINNCYAMISDIFTASKINNFSRLPDGSENIREFVKLFSILLSARESAIIQGFKWDIKRYKFEDKNGKPYWIELELDEVTFNILAQRYIELFDVENGKGNDKLPYDIRGYLTEFDAGSIDIDYVNDKFRKYVKILSDGDKALIESALNDLHKSFATLSQEKQEYAKLLLHDIESGAIELDENKTILDYINEYQLQVLNNKISHCAKTFGLDYDKLNELVSLHPSEANLNEFGRYDALKETLDIDKVKAYFEERDSTKYTKRKAVELFDKYLRDFILVSKIIKE